MTGPASASTSMISGVANSNNWPKEVQDLYEPVRVLGTGGFASVVLAKKKKKTKTKSDDNDNTGDDASFPTFVAMKMVGPTSANTMPSSSSESSLSSWQLYARRELDILRELSHPNIIKVIHVWETTTTSNNDKNNNSKRNSSSNTGPILMALQYAKGPTVQDLLLHRGALNPHGFGRIVIAQLVDAISYLHSHAVIHRDIKPDNIIVTGALSSQDCIWEIDAPATTTSTTTMAMADDATAATKSTNKTEEQPQQQQQQEDWETLRKKWHVTLIDFGFARALTPNDVANPSMAIRRENLDASYSLHNYLSGDDPDGSSKGKKKKIKNSSRHGGNHNLDASTKSSSSAALDRSISRKFRRQMSALGNRQYAAPEILKVQQISQKQQETSKIPKKLSKNITSPEQPPHNDGDDEEEGGSTTFFSTIPSETLTRTISTYVSEYGLLVDAYSLGHTIRYMLTGVPPHESVQEKIAYKKSIWYKLGKRLSSSKNKNKMKKIYRLETDLPDQVQILISNLTERLESNRTSVRSARRYPWIDAVLSPSDATIEHKDTNDEPTKNYVDNNKIAYLSLAMATQNIESQ